MATTVCYRAGTVARPRSSLQGGAASGPAEPDPRRPLGSGTLLPSADLNRLEWRCRRGLLENDLFVERFFERHGDTLDRAQAAGLARLMDLADNDRLDLLLARKQPEGKLAVPEVIEVLGLMRTRSAAPVRT